MQKQKEEEKKQFSLSLLMRIFLGLLVVISIGICAYSIMQYNELNREVEQLEAEVLELREMRAELVENLGSADELKRLLAEYKLYKDLIDADTATIEALEEYQAQLDYINELLHSSKYKNYIKKIATDKLNLYPANGENIYNDIN